MARPTKKQREAGYVNEVFTTDELVAKVREHALANYEAGGWDVIVEAYDDEQIRKLLGGASTWKGALKKFALVIDVYSERQADAAYHASQA